MFNKCATSIKIDVSKLGDHLLTHGLVATREQLGDIINPNHRPCDQLHSLLCHVSKAGGRHGYFLLYVSLFESAKKDDHQGHKDAVIELQKTGRFLAFWCSYSIYDVKSQLLQLERWTNRFLKASLRQ